LGLDIGYGHWNELVQADRSALPRAAAEELPDQPVLVVTQTANHRVRRLASQLGFQEVSVLEEFDAQQTLAIAPLGSFLAS
jgi:hypothetical protein